MTDLSERDLQSQIRLEAAQAGAKLFRINAGMGWTGEHVVRIHIDGHARVYAGDVIVRRARPFKTGWPKGGSDLFGWLPVQITADMVGRMVAVAVGIEVKRPQRHVTKEQANFLMQLRLDGGIAVLGRAVEDVVGGIRGWMNRPTT